MNYSEYRQEKDSSLGNEIFSGGLYQKTDWKFKRKESKRRGQKWIFYAQSMLPNIMARSPYW